MMDGLLYKNKTITKYPKLSIVKGITQHIFIINKKITWNIFEN